MVLSRLCMNLAEQNTKNWQPEFHAFIVNHKARFGSHEEAHLVSSQLQELGAHSAQEKAQPHGLIADRFTIYHSAIALAG